MKNLLIRVVFIAFVSFSSGFAIAQNNFWKDILESKIATGSSQKKAVLNHYRTLVLDTAQLTTFLQLIPKEFTENAKKNNAIILLPMPGGSFSRFRLTETSMMEPGLAAQFPGIKTYNGQGIDDPYATIKIDWSASGFHAMILSPVTGSVFIDPYGQQTLTSYISYFKKDYRQQKTFIENGLPLSQDLLSRPLAAARPQGPRCIGETLRSYRLAVACTGEYARAIGGPTVTVAQALAAIVTTINRVNGIYENELAIKLILINNESKIIYTDSAKDPFTGNADANVLINESQSVIDKNIGSANYDVGHTVSTESGGLAEVGVVCQNGSKAGGVTGNNPPSGDPFDVDYVAHEIGHEFGGVHTFNATSGSCSGNGDAGSNAEPGSGSTIMAYAGICDPQNDLQPNSDPQFHALSFDKITDYVTNANGNSCAVATATGNTPPVVVAGGNYTIPKLTPFVLTGSATDVNSDALTYSWEEINTGGPFSNWNNPSGDAPIFRSFPPVTVPVRYFPKMSDILNRTTTIGEVLPSYTRTLQFRLTARDNHSGAGGVCYDEMSVAVDGNAGPFAIAQPDTISVWDATTLKQVSWSVNNTNIAPINCANVAIDLSTDGGQTFPVVLLASTPNDGSENVVVPDIATGTARIRVRAADNIFFAVSGKNLKVQPFTFTAAASAANTVVLQWITSNEIDTLTYEIQRSIDGQTFSPAGQLKAAYPDSVHRYFFTDKEPFQGTNYYRLKETDASGKITYSKVVSVVLNQTSAQFVIYPNPAKYQTTLRIQAIMQGVAVRLSDVLGRRVFLKSIGTVTVGQEVQIPLVGLSRGVYFLTIISDTESVSRKIMVQ